MTFRPIGVSQLCKCIFRQCQLCVLSFQFLQTLFARLYFIPGRPRPFALFPPSLSLGILSSSFPIPSRFVCSRSSRSAGCRSSHLAAYHLILALLLARRLPFFAFLHLPWHSHAPPGTRVASFHVVVVSRGLSRNSPGTQAASPHMVAPQSFLITIFSLWLTTAPFSAWYAKRSLCCSSSAMLYICLALHWPNDYNPSRALICCSFTELHYTRWVITSGRDSDSNLSAWRLLVCLYAAVKCSLRTSSSSMHTGQQYILEVRS
ncbi:hypothetical protein BKA82DRAFT_715446 [Pisolithus tinctorius]|uniref:Uncharacterized protein n=1 Tax=Pisolithus tinctorius Marx 270 TaxID=870435 RepID=A0A0C3IZE8_PISTI|nr:hypothetical protein BKA82DRAFT_715446 [Pisolithus tinctorius]KIO02183.1 hypothetical protein M404DRAFT_715446 [Pisolithus tinctorius Marx 270]